MRLSHIHENEEVHDGYHCTSVDNAEDIKNNGFKSLPGNLRDYFIAVDDFNEIVSILAGMLNNKSAAKPLLDQFWSKTESLNNEEWIISLANAGDYETENRLADELNDIEDSLCAIWLNEFKNGTFIWLSGRQEEKYGDVCFSVTLPDTAIVIYSKSEPSYTLYFVPTRIPPQNFKPTVYPS
jgi:hypothetical protein